MLKTSGAHLRSRSPRMSLFTTVAVLLLVFQATNAGLVERTSTQDTNYRVGIVDSENLYHVCGASVIEARWLLTAAHCLMKPSTEEFYTPSELKVSDYGYIFQVDKIVKHDQFFSGVRDNEYMPNDIALVKTSTDMINWRWNIISLPTTQDTYERKYCTVTGWTPADWEYHPNIDNLQKEMGTVLRSECDDKLPLLFSDSNNICVRRITTAACIQDEGGPLICQDKLVGVAKARFGSFDCPADSPGMYQKVYMYRDWIKQITGITE